jgi:predicted component of type VI protein secretion system
MPVKVMQHISELLEQQTDAVSRSQLAALAGGNKQYAIQAIDHLLRLGYITETPGARNAKLVKTTNPFTVLEWENDLTRSPVPTRSAPVPERDNRAPVPTPPYGGVDRNGSSPEEHTPPVPEEQTSWTWVDELTPPNPEPDDGIPF